MPQSPPPGVERQFTYDIDDDLYPGWIQNVVSQLRRAAERGDVDGQSKLGFASGTQSQAILLKGAFAP
jgi:hypothetical protein